MKESNSNVVLWLLMLLTALILFGGTALSYYLFGR